MKSCLLIFISLLLVWTPQAFSLVPLENKINLKEFKPIVDLNKRYMLVDGDILVPKKTPLGDNLAAQSQKSLSGIPDVNRAFFSGSVSPWPNGVVPYQFDIDFPDSGKELITGWIDELNAQLKELDVPLVIQPRKSEQGYLRLTGPGKFAEDEFGGVLGAATLGYSPQENLMFLIYADKATFIHEMMHVFGALHEHSRSDRDSYVELNPTLPDYIADSPDFAIDLNGIDIGEYDINSITHYGVVPADTSDEDFYNKAFFRARPGVELIGDRTQMSELDVEGLKSVYSQTDFVNANENPSLSAIPEPPELIYAGQVASGSVHLAWLPSASADAVVGYEVFKNDERVDYIQGARLVGGVFPAAYTFYIDNNLTPGEEVSYKLRAVNELGNRSDFNKEIKLKAGPADSEVPSAVPSFTLNYSEEGEEKIITMSWSAAKALGPVAYDLIVYNFFGEKVLEATTNDLSYSFSTELFGTYVGLYEAHVTPVYNGTKGNTIVMVGSSYKNFEPALYEVDPLIALPDAKYQLETSEEMYSLVVINGKYCLNTDPSVPWADGIEHVTIDNSYDAVAVYWRLILGMELFEGLPCQ